MGAFFTADVGDSLIKRSIPTYSDDGLDSAIARLEANVSLRGCDELLQFARSEKSRRQAGGKPAAATTFSQKPATPRPSIKVFERSQKPAAAAPTEAPTTKPEDDPRVFEARVLAAKAQGLVSEAEARGESLNVAEAVRFASGAGVSDVEVLARKARDLVFAAEARGETLTVVDAVRLTKLEAAHGAMSVEIVARKAREKVQQYEAAGRHLDVCDAVRMVREGR